MTARITVVVIGRNEGERLTRCLASALAVATQRDIVYVDSASDDDSVLRAVAVGVVVVEVEGTALTAAAARNIGLKHATSELVFLVDGDTVIEPCFLDQALPHFDDPAVVAVWGQRWEARPHRSVYQSVLEVDGMLAVPHDFGGDVVVRRVPILEAGGYNETLIAGEDFEFCGRLRQAGLGTRHLPIPMTTHDLGITTWSQYWRRAYRTGYGFCDVAWIHRRDPQPLARQAVRRHLRHGALVSALVALAFRSPLAWAGLLLLTARVVWRHGELPLQLRLAYGVHTEVQQIPVLCGQVAWACDRMAGSQPVSSSIGRVRVSSFSEDRQGGSPGARQR